MTKLLQSSFLLLDSVLYQTEAYSRSKFKQILKHKNLPYSATAITRVLEYIYKEYGLALKFRRNGACYIIEEECSLSAIENVKFYKHLFLRDSIQRSLNAFEDVKDIISYSFETENKNSHYLPSILEAILDKQYIEFNYKKFYSKGSKDYVVAPLHIKEYLNRWYVIANSDKSRHQVFSLDRMLNLKVLHKKHKLSEEPTSEIFKNTIGMNFSGKLMKVRIWTDTDQYPYFETMPLHHSQRLEQKTEDGFIFTLHVTHNYELERWLLFYGSRIEVLDPLKLREKIKYEMKVALNRYK